MRTVVPSTEVMTTRAGSAQYSPSILLCVRPQKGGAPAEVDPADLEKNAAEADWQLLDKDKLKEGQLRAARSDKITSRDNEAVDTGTEIGFGQLAVRMPQQEQEAIEEAEPGLAPLSSFMLPGERLRSPPGELLKWYSVRKFEVALSLNGIQVGVSKQITRSTNTTCGARVTGCVEVFDVQRTLESACTDAN